MRGVAGLRNCKNWTTVSKKVENHCSREIKWRV